MAKGELINNIRGIFNPKAKGQIRIFVNDESYCDLPSESDDLDITALDTIEAEMIKQALNELT